MQSKIDKNRNFERLLGVLRFDAKKRFEILREELNYLVNAIRYRIGPADASKVAGAAPVTSNRTATRSDEPPNASDSRVAFLLRLEVSARGLLEECYADIEEIRWFEGYAAEVRVRLAPDKASNRRRIDDYWKFHILWNTKVVDKALVLAERLGDLHNRLDQFLQRTNPDNPEPILRRRMEQGLTDKYLSELSRWVHRDIATLANKMGANYPFEAVPSTYQFWVYDHTSSHHSFGKLEDHLKWAKLHDEDFPKKIAGQSRISKRFVSIAMSYWMPERMVLVPIIGHEIAHQVLRSIYGREVNFPVVERDESELGRVYRRLTGTVEAWLAKRVIYDGMDARIISNLVTEILCDVLAAIRFGYSYAYAWVLETLTEERFANLFHDEFGLLRRPERYEKKDGDLAEAETEHYVLEFESMQNDAFLLSGSLRRGIISPLYRGKVLVEVLRRLNLEQDEAATQFGDAFETLLTVLKGIYIGEAAGDLAESMAVRSAYESEMATDLARVVCEEIPIFTSIGNSEDSDILDNSQFIAVARQFWGTSKAKAEKSYSLTDFSLERQLMNDDYRRMYISTMATLQEKSKALGGVGNELVVKHDPTPWTFAVDNCRTFNDALWRTEWLVEVSKTKEADRTELDASYLESLKNRVRALTFLGMDDYLFRTANPARLFTVLEKFVNHAKTSFSPESDGTNSLVDEELRKVYNSQPIRDLDNFLFWKNHESMLPPKDTTELGDGRVFVLQDVFKELFAARILTPNSLSELVQCRNPDVTFSILYLDLVRVKSSVDFVDSNDSASNLLEMGAQHSKYKYLRSGALLGRYDAFVLYEQTNFDGGINWRFGKQSREVTKFEHTVERDFTYVSRCKRLVRIFGEYLTNFDLRTSNFHISSIILISLKWDASRTVVARWVASLKLFSEPGCTGAAFLSDGWEDLIVIFGEFHDPTNDQNSGVQLNVQNNVSPTEHPWTRLLQKLNNNPFVSNTETLFSSIMLKTPPTGMRFRFSIRVGSAGYAATKLNVVSVLEKIKSDAKLREVAGNEDFELLLDTEKDCERASIIFQALHRELNGGSRMETRISWMNS